MLCIVYSGISDTFTFFKDILMSIQYFMLSFFSHPYIGYPNVHGTHVTANNSTTNNIVFFLFQI